MLKVIEFAEAPPVNATMQPAMAAVVNELFFRLNNDCIPFPPSPAQVATGRCIERPLRRMGRHAIQLRCVLERLPFPEEAKTKTLF